MKTPNSAFPYTCENLIIVAGHYGVGKTNFSLNLAMDLAKSNLGVSVVDLDIVNPYFRSSDYTNFLEASGIEVVAPVLARSSVDVPSLSAHVNAVIEQAQTGERITIIDVGGDDVGAGVLGRFAQQIMDGAYTMMMVVNAYRNLTQTPDEALEILKLIEKSCGLSASCIVNNSHIMNDTTPQIVVDSYLFGQEVAQRGELVLAATCASKSLLKSDVNRVFLNEAIPNLYPVEVYVKKPWE